MHAASLNRRTPIGRDGASNRDTLREISARSLMTRRGGLLTIARRRLISQGSRLRAALARISQPTSRAPRRNRNRDCNDPCQRGTVKGRRVNDEIRFFFVVPLPIRSFVPSLARPSAFLLFLHSSAVAPSVALLCNAVQHARTKRIGELRRLKFNSARGRAAN